MGLSEHISLWCCLLTRVFSPVHTDASYADWAFTYFVGRTTDLPTKRKPKVRPLLGGGMNFVDVSLRVVVKASCSTLMAHRPNYSHGTTYGYDASNLSLSIAFSERLAKAWAGKTNEVLQGMVSGEGAGPESH